MRRKGYNKWMLYIYNELIKQGVKIKKQDLK